MSRATQLAAVVVLALSLVTVGTDLCLCCAPAPVNGQAHACCASPGPSLRADRSCCGCMALLQETALVEQRSSPVAQSLSPGVPGLVDHSGAWLTRSCGPAVARVALSPPPPTVLRI